MTANDIYWVFFGALMAFTVVGALGILSMKRK